MEQDFLVKIREAEVKADEIRNAAKDKARSMENDASAEAKKINTQCELELIRERDEIIQASAENAKRQTKNQGAELNIELSVLRQNTRKRMDEAVEYVIAKVVDA